MFQFFDQVLAFFQSIEDFKSSGIYQFFTELFAQAVIYLTVSAIKFKLLMLGLAWDTAKEILNQLNLSGAISAAFSALDSRITNMLAFFRVPECINIVSSAYVTRYVLSFVGL